VRGWDVDPGVNVEPLVLGGELLPAVAPSGFVVIVGGGCSTTRRSEAAWREGNLRAHVKGCRHLGHVGTLFSHAIV
jgi:hypothetical protein